ncbi:glycerol-3-phosphate acyltransferase [Oceanithermus desulfurans]|uniref:Membrane protein n=2 Tax=Oceanithermus desulfurans TaxID=227924 RepID=A0A511RIR4_9DEIN|nr:glycerol-3-phosphate acyltransferase [Oceanithermus desulfurans]MBB6030588.1 acyl-phosphate glycerol 3-phosphate acyltransferase [Oceanithermus desulfurans]GEM89533.1 membrane protein [Oceanithermus desulfurans NBRC 100063]
MNAVDLLWILLSYLIGSISWGLIFGFAHGLDLRRRDLPGGSGVFRQLGPVWGVLTALLDAAKGALVALLAAQAPGGLAPWMATAVVAGHCWPVYFGFSGGGGLAPSLGFFLVFRPAVTLVALAVVAVVALLYYPWWRRRGGVLGIYPIPFAALFGYAYALWALQDDREGFRAMLGVTVVVLVRGLRLLKGRR